MTATRLPKYAACAAPFAPAGPPPMTTRSNRPHMERRWYHARLVHVTMPLGLRYMYGRCTRNDAPGASLLFVAFVAVVGGGAGARADAPSAGEVEAAVGMLGGGATWEIGLRQIGVLWERELAAATWDEQAAGPRAFVARV